MKDTIHAYTWTDVEKENVIIKRSEGRNKQNKRGKKTDWVT